MSLEAVLARLEKVKGRGNSFSACCPAHSDKSPSLTIRQAENRILMHCFAGCSTEEVLGAIGMTFDDLFPEKEKWHRQKPVRTKFFATDLLRVINREALIVVVAAIDMAGGKKLNEGDLERLKVAAQRIEEAVRLSGE